MNRRVLYALALLLLGLMVGLIIGRFFMPERYGVVTMILLFVGGLTTGVLGLRAWIMWRGENSSSLNDKPSELVARFGTRNVTVRWDAVWWGHFQARWLGIEQDGSRSFWDVWWADVQAPNAGIFLGAFLVSLMAQILILGSQLIIGLGLYLLAGMVVLFWVWRQDISLFHLVSAARIGRRVEIVCLIAIVLIAFGARMIQVGDLPAGIDGDELKRTAEAYSQLVAQESGGSLSGQFKWAPVSFYVDKLAFDWFGVAFGSPRVMTALLSVLATLFYYFVARDMFNVSIALISTLLMASSYYDVNTSRQAMVETLTKLPLILAMFLVIRGIDRQRWFYFLLCGIVLYVGVMTYDTFFVVPLAIGLYVIFRLVTDWRNSLRWLLYLTLLAAPLLLAYPIAAETFSQGQYIYINGASAGLQELLTTRDVTPLLDKATDSLAALFQILENGDFALSWAGPLVNPLVLPFFLIGLTLVLTRFWQRHNFLLILLFLFCFFGVPILSGYTVPGAFYIGLPPIFIFSGVGMVAVAAALLSLNRDRLVMARVVTAGIAALLLLIGISDGFIFAGQLNQQPDALKRRALVQVMQESVQSAPYTFLPTTRGSDEYGGENRTVMNFLASAVNDIGKSGQDVAILDFAALPGALGEIANQIERVNVVYDRETDNKDASASNTIETIKRCYGGVQSAGNEYFEVYSLEQVALRAPNCYSLSSLEGVRPNPDAPVSANQPLTFAWEAESNRPKQFQIQVEERDPRLVWLEGEGLPRENGWVFEAKSDHFPGFSGVGYLLDNQGAARLNTQVDIPQSGEYAAWVRYLRPAKDGYASSLNIGNQIFEFACADVPLGEWHWERVGTANLAQGANALWLTRDYGVEPYGWKPILVDAIFLSGNPDLNPEEGGLWKTVHETRQIESSESQYLLEAGLPPGTYRWRVRLLDGAKLVDAGGRRGVWSELLEFRVE